MFCASAVRRHATAGVALSKGARTHVATGKVRNSPRRITRLIGDSHTSHSVLQKLAPYRRVSTCHVIGACLKVPSNCVPRVRRTHLAATRLLRALKITCTRQFSTCAISNGAPCNGSGAGARGAGCCPMPMRVPDAVSDCGGTGPYRR